MRLPARLGAEDRGDLDVRIRGDERDPVSGVIGIADTLSMTRTLRAAVRDAVAAGARPLVLGGCCALVPGALAGLRDAIGALGVAYVDGHVDVYDGATSPTGEGADMPMSVAFGLGPEAWVQRRRRRERRARRRRRARRARPRGGAGHRRAAARTRWRDVEVLGPGELRAEGLAAAGAQGCAAARGRRRALLDPPRRRRARRARHARDGLPHARRPASGTRSPRSCARSAPPRALAGLSIGCLNPEKDPGGAYTEKTCALLAGALAPD